MILQTMRGRTTDGRSAEEAGAGQADDPELGGATHRGGVFRWEDRIECAYDHSPKVAGHEGDVEGDVAYFSKDSDEYASTDRESDDQHIRVEPAGKEAGQEKYGGL